MRRGWSGGSGLGGEGLLVVADGSGGSVVVGGEGSSYGSFGLAIGERYGGGILGGTRGVELSRGLLNEALLGPHEGHSLVARQVMNKELEVLIQ